MTSQLTDASEGNRKKPRAMITINQKQLLEAHFSKGMDSAALRLQHLHDVAAAETGLEQYVIRNWIRNRRRTAPQKTQAQRSIPDSEGKCTVRFSNTMIIKARIADTAEIDFVDVEVEGGSYINLLKACCVELEVPLGEVVKIRKLPNTLIRKDQDVARVEEGQEIELIIKT